MTYRVKNESDRKLVVNLASGTTIRLPAKGTPHEPVEIADSDRQSSELVCLERARPKAHVSITLVAPAPVVDEPAAERVTPKRASRGQEG